MAALQHGQVTSLKRVDTLRACGQGPQSHHAAEMVEIASITSAASPISERGNQLRKRR
jgi:hypothetical protein